MMDSGQHFEVVAAGRRPRIWLVLIAPWAALAATILLQIGAATAVILREMYRGVAAAELAERAPEIFTTPGAFILLAACGQIAFGLAALVPAWLSKTPVRERLGLVPTNCSRTIYPLAAIGSLAPTGAGFGLAWALAQIIPPDRSAALLFEKMTLAWAAPFVLFIALAPGFCEELLFRGYMQTRLLQRWRPWAAITVTSVVFAVLHIMPHAMVLTLLLGLWFGVVAWRTGSIWPCIASHAFVNGSVNLWRVIVKFGQFSETAQWAVSIAALLAGIVCFVIACRQLFSTAAPPQEALAEAAP